VRDGSLSCCRGGPLEFDYCHSRLAGGEAAVWVRQRFRRACAAFGAEAREEAAPLAVEWPC
jgi:poly-gamma-glutamate synthesis protein (capsule biosynthesis protein)